MKYLELLLTAAEWLLLLAVLIYAWVCKNWLIVTFLIPLFFIIAFNWYRNRKRSNMLDFLLNESKKASASETIEWDKEEEEKLHLIRKRVELFTLQSQINPHFLYNTLDSIRSKALMEGQQEVAAMTEKLSKFFRYCISNKEYLVKISEELHHIQNYYYLQKHRFGERFEMEVLLEDEEIGDLYIPKMTLQPLVENAIGHGLEKVSRKGLIQIHIIRTDNRVLMTISDNGAGMSREQLDKLNYRLDHSLGDAGSKQGHHTNIALTNVNARIRLNLGEEYGIRYRSLENEGTDAIVTIPLIDDFMRAKVEKNLIYEEQ